MNSMKTNLLHRQSSPEFPKKNTEKPYILSLIVLLILIVAGILTVTTVLIIDESSPSTSYAFVAPTPTRSIRAVCSFTPYKRLCRYTISSSVFNNKSRDEREQDTHYLSPKNIIVHSYQLGVKQLVHLSSLHNISESASVLRECQVLLKKEVPGLNVSAALANNFYSLRLELEENVARFNRMERHQQACLDKLDATAESRVTEMIKLNVRKMRRYTRNTRAILLNIDSILDEIYGAPSFSVDQYSYYSYYFDGLSYEYMIVCVSQYTFLMALLILMLKLY